MTLDHPANPSGGRIEPRGPSIFRRICSTAIDGVCCTVFTIVFVSIAFTAATNLTATIEGAKEPERLNAIMRSADGWENPIWIGTFGLCELMIQIAGSSPGLRAMGLRIADDRGAPPGWRGVTRSLVIAVLFTRLAPLFAASLVGLWAWKRRAPWDVLSGTRVILRNPTAAQIAPIEEPAPGTM